MRQVVSLIKDGHVLYALVDEDEGELTQFAQILLPDPDRFGLHEAALLGTNLITTIGLNGRRPKRATEPLALPEAATPELDVVATESQYQRTLRLARERKQRARDAAKATPAGLEQKRLKARQSYYRKKGYSNEEAQTLAAAQPGRTGTVPPPPGQVRSDAARTANDAMDPGLTKKGTPRTRALPDPAKRVKRFISLDDVVAIINQYPEGITCKQIGERIWRGWGHDGEAERWVVRSVENRVNNLGNAPRQFRQSHRMEGSFKRKYLHPLETT